MRLDPVRMSTLSYKDTLLFDNDNLVWDLDELSTL